MVKNPIKTILAIDTSCDETAAAVTNRLSILSNVVWSQVNLHSGYGGVYPTLAKRAHQKKIGTVVDKALITAFPTRLKVSSLSPLSNIDAVAVTIGPGLAPSLEVGINKAKEMAIKHKKPLFSINHIEAHLISPLAKNRQCSTNQIPLINKFPKLGLVVSGGNTLFVLIDKIGKYKILSQTIDDALGEALDKAARMLGLGYPGGAVLEKFAKKGDLNSYNLPIPMVGRENEGKLSYSGLKTAMYKLVEKEKPLTKKKIANLAACFQNIAFNHLIRVIDHQISHYKSGPINQLLIGGGVGANVNLRNKLRRLAKTHNLQLITPYAQRLYGDNAAMIGVCAYAKLATNNIHPLVKKQDINKIDRIPRWEITKVL